MRASEFIVEAKPENLGQPVLDKLFDKYSKRDINDTTLSQKFTDGAGVANYIYQLIGPKNLIWVAKQYINDYYFFLHQLDEVKTMLDAFATASRGRIPIEKDINKYQSISDLRTTMDELKKTVGGTGSNYFRKAVERINEMVTAGQAEWLYKGNDYVIYHPKTFEASHMMSALISTTICTIMNEEYFDDYSAQGYLMYTIPNSEPSKLYNCYVNDGYVIQSEAADEQNNHPPGGGAAQIKHQTDLFPALTPLVKKVMTSGTDLNVQLMFTPQNQQYNLCLSAVQRSGWSLEFVPEELIDYKLCLEAIKENEEAFQFVPEELKDYKLCLAAVEFAGSFIDEIPTDLIDYKLCLAAVRSSSWALRYMFNHLPFTMKKLTPKERRNLYLTAVEADGSAIEFGPEELRDYEICLTAIQNGGAMKYVPAPIRAKIQAGMR